MPKRLTASWLASLSDEEFAAVAQCVHSDAYGYWGKMNLRTAHDHQQAVFREQSIRTRRPPGGYSYQPTNEGTLYTCTDCKATGLHQMDNVVHHAECIVFELDRRAEKRS